LFSNFSIQVTQLTRRNSDPYTQTDLLLEEVKRILNQKVNL